MNGFVALAALALIVAAAPLAHAQISDDQIRGSVWVAHTGAVRPMYVFGADGTYTFTPGGRGRYVSHSGTWTLIDDGRRLQLYSTSRVERVRGRERLRTANRTFTLPIGDIGDGFIQIEGRRYTRG